MIRRIVNLVGELEGLWFLLTVVLGIGVLGYVAGNWLIQLATQGRYFAVVAVLLVALPVTGGTLLRVPIAQIIFFGSAVVCGTAFLMGYTSTLLPPQ